MTLNVIPAALLALALSSLAACDTARAKNTGNADLLAGTASVIDGDTIEIHGERVRLSGIDTPERGSRCGDINVYQKAAFALSDMIGSRTVSCEITDTDRYDRKVGHCQAAGQSLQSAMVREGWARDWPRYSGGAFAQDERTARSAGAGIWGLQCPEDLWGERSYE